MQGNRASSRGKGEVSWVFSSCSINLGYIFELRRGCPFETRLCSEKSRHLSRNDGHLRKINEAWQVNTDTSGIQAENQASFSSWQTDIGIPITFQEESGIVTFWSIELCMPLEVSRDLRTLSRCGGHLGIYVGSPQGFHTSLHLVWWKTSLHSSHCRDIQLSFVSGYLGIHSTWGSKLRVPLIYPLLREGYSWGTCEKLAYLFNRNLAILSLLKKIWCPWKFPRGPVLNLVFL